jgi:hypothetical protein
MTASVSGSAGWSRRPAADGGACRLSWADGGPVVTAVVRCDPVVHGPNVAPLWPRQSRAWKAGSGRGPIPAPTPNARSEPITQEPRLTAGDRFYPSVRACGGHGPIRNDRPSPSVCTAKAPMGSRLNSMSWPHVTPETVDFPPTRPPLRGQGAVREGAARSAAETVGIPVTKPPLGVAGLRHSLQPLVSGSAGGRDRAQR